MTFPKSIGRGASRAHRDGQAPAGAGSPLFSRPVAVARGLDKIAGQSPVSRRLAARPRSPDRQLTVALGVQSWHSASRADSRWHALWRAVPGLNTRGPPPETWTDSIVGGGRRGGCRTGGG